MRSLLSCLLSNSSKFRFLRLCDFAVGFPQRRSSPLKNVALLALAPLLLANQFTAREFAFAATFIAHIQERQLLTAKKMLAPDVVIRAWSDYSGPPKSFEDFVTYISKCPVHDLEGVDTKDAQTSM